MTRPCPFYKGNKLAARFLYSGGLLALATNFVVGADFTRICERAFAAYACAHIPKTTKYRRGESPSLSQGGAVPPSTLRGVLSPPTCPPLHGVRERIYADAWKHKAQWQIDEAIVDWCKWRRYMDTPLSLCKRNDYLISPGIGEVWSRCATNIGTQP